MNSFFRASVHLVRCKDTSSEPGVCDHIRTKEELISQFVPSFSDVRLGKEQFTNTRQELCDAIDNCDYVFKKSLEQSQCFEEAGHSSTVSCHNRKCFSYNEQDTVSRSDTNCFLDLGKYLLDKKNWVQGKQITLW